jgi:periplasmic divalent cation tolerance protein
VTKTKAVLVLSTFSDDKSAAEISRKLVEKGFCACVNLAEIRSIYTWKGKVEDQKEFLAVFKTTRKSAKKLKAELDRMHPYEVPEIVEVKLSDVSKPYFDWMTSSTNSVTKDRNHPAKR